MNNPKDILHQALISEKATTLQEQANCYVFKVATEANKLEIKKAVEKAIIVLNQLKEVLEKNGCKIKHLSAPITVIGRGSGKVMFKL